MTSPAADPAEWLLRVGAAAGLEASLPDVVPTDIELAAELLEARHGPPGARFAEVAFGFGTDRAEVFEAKNASLRLSVEISLMWNRAVYLRELSALGDLIADLRPGRILDLGCEQGIVTCFIASSLPEAEVIGVDRSPAAVARARELAAATGTGHVRFEAGDFLSEPLGGADGSPTAGSGGGPSGVSGPADLVVCSRSMIGEALPGVGENGWSRDSAASAAARLAGMIGETGVLFLLERGSPESLAEWFDLLAACGLVARQVAGFACDEPSNPGQEFTIAVARGAPDAPVQPVS